MATTTIVTINDDNWTEVTLIGTTMIVGPIDKSFIERSFSNPPINTDIAPTIPQTFREKFDKTIYVRSKEFPYKISVEQ